MKNLLILLMLVVITPVLTSCGDSKTTETPTVDGGTPSTPEEKVVQAKLEKLEEFMTYFRSTASLIPFLY